MWKASGVQKEILEILSTNHKDFFPRIAEPAADLVQVGHRHDKGRHLADTYQQGDLSYRAIAGEKHTQGNSAGEALDALTAQLSADETSTLVVVQSLRPDRFFTAAQQQRLDALMARWRTLRDQGASLPADEQTELEALIAAELRASSAWAAALADALGR